MVFAMRTIPHPIYHAFLVAVGLFGWWLSTRIASTDPSVITSIVFRGLIPFSCGFMIGMNTGLLVKDLRAS